MKKLYEDGDLLDAVKQKRRLLAIFLAVTALFLGGFATLLTFYILLPYNDPTGVWYVVGTSVLAGLYIIFCFPYMGISYKRCRAYCKMLKFISVGLKEYSVLPFEGIDDWTTRDGVDVNVALFSVKNVKKDETMTRQIYVDGEKDFPAFAEGKTARLISQGNLLIAYELTEEEA